MHVVRRLRWRLDATVFDQQKLAHAAQQPGKIQRLFHHFDPRFARHGNSCFSLRISPKVPHPFSSGMFISTKAM